ncbi:MAG: sulfotransferase [Sphingomonadaceae bacterium]
MATNTIANSESVRATLDIDAIIEEAREAAEGRRFVSEDFRYPLSHLLRISAEDLVFRSEGLATMRRDLVRVLTNRLRYERDVHDHPRIAEEIVTPPMIITGLPRSGSTKLQRLIAADPQVRSLLTWQALYPAPINDMAFSGPDPRIDLAATYVAAQDKVKASHAHVVDQPEEEFYLLIQSLESVFEINYVPSRRYLDWIRGRNREPSYRFLHRMLQYLQWQSNVPGEMPWILKSPAHLGSLDMICEVFPGATVLHTYRDPVEFAQSWCYMMQSHWGPLYAHVTSEYIGRHCLKHWSGEMERFKRQRELLGSRLNIIDVPYEDIVADPVGVTGKFYSRAGHELSDASIAAMKAWDADNPQYKHGKPEYSLESFGLSKSEIWECLDWRG